ncbi:hypothetical protein SDC9_187054 [bioreactor metagenome]|uniref:Uncharacterized protein n=1 Tax=bioreactor metagenome TaxID=1076179 RepID=A0A645HLW4_9ZZZZ
MFAIDVEPAPVRPQPLFRILADHGFQSGGAFLGQNFDIVFGIGGGLVFDQRSHLHFEFEAVSRQAPGQFGHDRDAGFEMKQRRRGMGPAGLSEKHGFDAFIRRRVLVDQQCDVFMAAQRFHDAADAAAFVEHFVHRGASVL